MRCAIRSARLACASPPAARKASGSAAWVPESIAVAVGTPGGDAEEGDKYARRGASSSGGNGAFVRLCVRARSRHECIARAPLTSRAPRRRLTAASAVPLHTRSLQQLQQLLPSWAGGGAPQASAARSAAPATPGRRACAADGDSLGEPSTTRRRKPQRRASLRQLKDPRTMLVLIALLYVRLAPPAARVACSPGIFHCACVAGIADACARCADACAARAPARSCCCTVACRRSSGIDVLAAVHTPPVRARRVVSIMTSSWAWASARAAVRRRS